MSLDLKTFVDLKELLVSFVKNVCKLKFTSGSIIIIPLYQKANLHCVDGVAASYFQEFKRKQLSLEIIDLGH